jgi:transposase-like protein
MSEHAAEGKTIKTLLAGVEAAVMTQALHDLGGVPVDGGHDQNIPLQGVTVRVHPLLDTETDEAAWTSALADADAVTLLLRHGDIFTMEALRRVKTRLASHPSALPLAVLVYRELDVEEFKISCPACGQKLWVRDADANKRGKCTTCGQSFTISDITRHVRVELSLAKDTPIAVAHANNPIALQAAIINQVRPMVGRILEDEDFLVGEVIKSNTVRVKIQQGN